MMNYNNFMVNPQATMAPTLSPSYIAFLTNFVRNNIILIDASIAMKDSFSLLMRDLFLPLKANGKAVVMLQAVVEQIKKLSQSTDVEKSAKALKALSDINLLREYGILVYRGRPNTGSSANAEILKFVASHVFSDDSNEDIAVLTQSGVLNDDCKIFSQIKSCTPYRTVSVKRISNQFGQLKEFNKDFISNNSSTNTPQPTGQKSLGSEITELCKKLGI